MKQGYLTLTLICSAPINRPIPTTDATNLLEHVHCPPTHQEKERDTILMFNFEFLVSFQPNRFL